MKQFKGFLTEQDKKKKEEAKKPHAVKDGEVPMIRSCSRMNKQTVVKTPRAPVVS